MKVSRRSFLILTGSFVAGCSSTETRGPLATGPPRLVNAGPLSAYPREGVYDAFGNQGFFIIRRGDRVLALSSTCTHKRCRLKAQPDRTFYCPCHGSSFDPEGHVLRGPAVRDLPVFETSTEAGQLQVRVPARVS
jgi:Rieske Fe-S protein